MSKKKKDSTDDINYLCHQCASDIGWSWPDGHVATQHEGVCDVCGKKRGLTCQNDWLKRGQKKLRSWD
jgi:hypothetical protein